LPAASQSFHNAGEPPQAKRCKHDGGNEWPIPLNN
jgi:hypothetical protein